MVHTKAQDDFCFLLWLETKMFIINGLSTLVTSFDRTGFRWVHPCCFFVQAK